MPDFGIFRGFNEKLFGDKLVAGQLPTQLGLIGSKYFGFDTDALAFFARVTTAGGTLSAIEQTAIDTLVVQMKADGIWTKMKAIYPMVGASSAACAQNLKSSSFTGTFTSGWTFASTGVTPNGTSAYMNTAFNPLTQSLPRNSGSLGVYNRSNTSVQGGHGQRVSNAFELFDHYVGTTYCYINNGLSGFNVVTPNSLGLFQGSRTSASDIAISKNNTIYNGTKSTTGDSNGNLWIGASNNGGSGTFFNNKEIAFFYIAEGYDNTEMQNIYTAVQAFQTTLSRQV